MDSLLSRAASAGSRSVRIRRDLSPKARSARTLLLKERRNLIESGVERSDIALQRMSLLVKGRVYGTIRGDTFKLAGASTSPLVTAPFHCLSVPVSTSSSPLANAPFSSSSNSECSAQRLLLLLPPLVLLLYDYVVLRSSFGTLGVLSTSLNFFSRMFIPKLLMLLLLLRLGVPVVYLIVKFSPLVIQSIIKIVTQEEEGFYMLFLIVFALGKFSLLTWSAS